MIFHCRFIIEFCVEIKEQLKRGPKKKLKKCHSHEVQIQSNVSRLKRDDEQKKLIEKLYLFSTTQTKKPTEINSPEIAALELCAHTNTKTLHLT